MYLPKGHTEVEAALSLCFEAAGHHFSTNSYYQEHADKLEALKDDPSAFRDHVDWIKQDLIQRVEFEV